MLQFVINDLRENTELFAEFGKDGGENIVGRNTNSRKLGLSLQTTSQDLELIIRF